MPADPFTLRAVSGLPTSPGPLSESTLLIIDAQVEYTGGALELVGVDAALDTLQAVLARARSEGCPVIHVAHLGASGGAFDPDGGGRIIDAVAPVEGESIVTKNLPNAFAGTDLAGQLRAHGDRPLVIGGFMTHMCVSATARAATDLGFDSVVLSDATATRSLPSASGSGSVPAAALHEAALAALADRFSVVAPATALL
ncbi:MAG: cysteine hydrolase family protein [Acidimicrobiia bacterium]|nr:cysteine hydrolase family protein [Acidimicrobiia bacterium]